MKKSIYLCEKKRGSTITLVKLTKIHKPGLIKKDSNIHSACLIRFLMLYSCHTNDQFVRFPLSLQQIWTYYARLQFAPEPFVFELEMPCSRSVTS